ncbi:MAG: ATP-dependent DNA helicase DinG, partial [Verrucomicrobia bacterium]|nr:ATP-dependent DNA helicase DinG [Verrucomicrobiota bacterium]
RSRMGIGSGETFPILEKIYPSPFSYKTQVLFGCPTDMPAPDSPDYQERSIAAIKQLVQASNGNAFILFTSYEQLKASFDALHQPLSDLGYHLLKHGDDQRQNLIKRFKQQPRSILFGTDSFWEGVDIIGDALRCVIITKLPFPVPSEPISEAKAELIIAQGGSPFMEYSLPRAIVKFKQAFGRLIRHKDDRGCCICLDVRLKKKGYGRLFTESLPECLEAFEPLEQLRQKMVDFYRKNK